MAAVGNMYIRLSKFPVTLFAPVLSPLQCLIDTSGAMMVRSVRLHPVIVATLGHERVTRATLCCLWSNALCVPVRPTRVSWLRRKGRNPA